MVAKLVVPPTFGQGGAHLTSDGSSGTPNLKELIENAYNFVGQEGANLQSSWYIDADNGDDNAEGSTQASAVKTFGEVRRRIGNKAIAQPTNFKFLGNFDQTNPVIIAGLETDPAAQLTFENGNTITPAYTGTFTSVTAINRATNQANEITDTNLSDEWVNLGYINTNADWPTGVMTRVRITSGGSAGAVAYPVKDLGSKTARTGPFGIPAGFNSPPATSSARKKVPAGSDAYVVESGFSRIDVFVLDVNMTPIGAALPGQPQIIVKELELNPSVVNNHHVRSRGEPVAGGPPKIIFTGCAVGRLAPVYGGKVAYDFCRVGGSSLTIQNSLLQLAGCTVLADVTVLEGGRVVCYADTMWQGAGLKVFGRARIGDTAIFDAPADAIEIMYGGAIWTESLFAVPFGGGKALYGSGNTGAGVRLHVGSSMAWESNSEASPDLAGVTLTGASDSIVAGTTKTWASLLTGYTELNKQATIARDD